MTKTFKRSAIGVLLLLATVLLVWTLLKQTTARFAMDLNPTVQIELNRMNRVNKLRPVNQDGQKLLAQYQGEGKRMETVVRELVDLLVLQGYLDNRDDNTVLLTSYGVSDPNTLYRIEEMLEETIADRNLRTSVRHASDDAETRLGDEAKDLGVSAGKLELMRLVTKKHPTLADDELKNRPIGDLVGLLEDDDDRNETERPQTDQKKENDTQKTEKPRTEAPRTEAPRTEPARTPAPAATPRWDDDDWDDDDWDDDDWDDDDWDDDDWDDDDWDDDDDDDWDDDDDDE